MKIKINGEVEVNGKGSMWRIEEEGKTTFPEGDEDNGMVMTRVTVKETKGIQIMTAKIMGTEVGDGMAAEGKAIVIGEGEEDGTQIPNILNKNTHNNTQSKITIGPLQWVVNTNIRCLTNSTHPTYNHNSITHKDHPHNHVKQKISVSCVKIKAIMTINANLQVISWPDHRKPLIKDIRTTTKTRIKGNGQMRTTIIMTPMASLFSKGGSQCC